MNYSGGLGIGVIQEDSQGARERTKKIWDKALREGSSTYTTGKGDHGNGERVLVIGGTGYIGQALIPELSARGYQPVVLSRQTGFQEKFPNAEVIAGSVCDRADLKRAFANGQIEGVITLLACRNIIDEALCWQVDYVANNSIIEEAREQGVKHLIHTSDYGAYRPKLPTQFYKLRIEGELLGQHHAPLNFTIIRPTSYFPHLSLNFETARSGKPVPIFEHGEWGIFNPIAREDLAEFFVNTLFEENRFGKILPVGGPWVPENMCTAKSSSDMMFEVLGMESRYKTISMKSWDRLIRMAKYIGVLIPMVRRGMFYMQAIKYWSTTSHFAPAYGTRTLKDFYRKLAQREYKPKGFFERMRGGTAAMPTDI